MNLQAVSAFINTNSFARDRARDDVVQPPSRSERSQVRESQQAPQDEVTLGSPTSADRAEQESAFIYQRPSVNPVNTAESAELFTNTPALPQDQQVNVTIDNDSQAVEDSVFARQVDPNENTASIVIEARSNPALQAFEQVSQLREQSQFVDTYA